MEKLGVAVAFLAPRHSRLLFLMSFFCLKKVVKGGFSSSKGSRVFLRWVAIHLNLEVEDKIFRLPDVLPQITKSVSVSTLESFPHSFQLLEKNKLQIAINLHSPNRGDKISEGEVRNPHLLKFETPFHLG